MPFLLATLLLAAGFALARRVLVVAFLYIVGGYAVVSAIYKVSEFGRAVDEGRLELG